MESTDEADGLSTVARQCMAVTCLTRFCRKYDIQIQAIQDFIEHVWKVAQVEPETWLAWEQGFSTLAVNGHGDPLPRKVKIKVPRDLHDPLLSMIQHVFETSASTWYGNNTPATKKHLMAVFEICKAHNIAIPDPSLYKQLNMEGHTDWGPQLTHEELNKWRQLV